MVLTGPPGRARRTIDHLARVGFLGQGVVYLVLGGLALRAARGAAALPTGPVDALRTLAEPGGAPTAHPFALGALPLLVVVLGAFGYAAWQLVTAASDAGDEGRGPWGLVQRLGRVMSAVLYAILAAGIVRLLTQPLAPAKGDAVTYLTARALAVPFGRWLVGAVGLGVMSYGVYELVRAGRTPVDPRLALGRMRPALRTAAVRLGRVGLVAHGLVFGLIGSFLVRAALLRDARQAAGIGGALRSLVYDREGPWLLAAIALGLVAFGVFQTLHACYREVEMPRSG